MAPKPTRRPAPAKRTAAAAPGKRAARARRAAPAARAKRSAAAPDEARFFADEAAWRAWLERHHARVDELWVGLHKKASGIPSLDWPQAVDGALCFGWIDGVRQSLDEDRYRIRFTPRRPGSTWSTVNLARAKVLAREGKMAPAGLKALEARDPVRSGTYSYEQRSAARLEPAHQRRLQADARAWAFFQAQPPWYRRTATWWIVSAKREETKLKRLETLIADSARGRTIAPLTRKPR